MGKPKRYKYYINEEKKKVVAISSFAQKPVRGVAVCYDSDEFSVEEGKKIAKLKCDIEIEKRRLKYAQIRLKEAKIAVATSTAELRESETYLENSELVLADLLAEYQDKYSGKGQY